MQVVDSKRNPFIARTLAAVVLAAASSGCVEMPIRNYTVHLGQRALDADGWEPVSDQLTLGVETDTYRPADGWGMEMGALYSRDEGTRAIDGLSSVEAKGATWELYLGARKTLKTSVGKAHPYLGGGLTWIWSDFEASSGDQTLSGSDDSPALYLHCGVIWRVGASLNVGLDLRVVTGASADMFGIDGDADYAQVALGVGFQF
ncbi:MAG: outer membrane beta-barrel protein [Planctomycetota bacterium]|nr:outer membrane beta-barrel protein [Planctomycetota bacterium]